MKNKKYIMILFSILCIICFFGCEDFYEPNSILDSSSIYGTFNLQISEPKSSRTIIPVVQEEYLLYRLVFSTGGQEDIIYERMINTITNTITLPAAIWNLTVTAFIDSEKSKPIAQAIMNGIIINAGNNTSRNLELEPIIETGSTGTFVWNISFPSSVTVASVTITPDNLLTGTARQKLFFKGGTPLVSPNNYSTPLNLRTGYYHVEFSLSNGEYETGRIEYLHVYKNLQSEFTYTFTQEHFISSSVTNGNNSGAGSLRFAIENAPNNSEIFIKDTVGTILLTGRIEITKNLIIQGNGVTITRAPSWTTINDDSQFILIDSNISVEINRVHFRNGRANNYGSAISNYRGNLILNSCIFSGNISYPVYSNSGGTIYNGRYSNADAILSIKACTFYDNRNDNTDGGGGAVCNNSSRATLNIQGNLFVAANYNATYTERYYYPIIYNHQGTVNSLGFNAVGCIDPTYNLVITIGTTNSAFSGWNSGVGDITMAGIPVSPSTFQPNSGSAVLGIITTIPDKYPMIDFYGRPINNNAAAGAVQSF